MNFPSPCFLCEEQNWHAIELLPFGGEAEAFPGISKLGWSVWRAMGWRTRHPTNTRV